MKNDNQLDKKKTGNVFKRKDQKGFPKMQQTSTKEAIKRAGPPPET